MTHEYILKKSLFEAPACGIENPNHYTNQYKYRLEETEQVIFSPGYAEPGYSDTEKGILVGNWNRFSFRVCELLENYGYTLQWEDEWCECYECGKIMRCAPDSYDWQPVYIFVDGSYLCPECRSDEDIESMLESKENDFTTAVNDASLNLENYGYVKIAEYESGHYGQSDEPGKILAEYTGQYPRLLFQIDDTEQFCIHFSLWYKK